MSEDAQEIIAIGAWMGFVATLFLVLMFNIPNIPQHPSTLTKVGESQ